MTTQIKVALIAAAGLIITAVIAGIFSLAPSSNGKIIQTVECGAAITNTNGNAVINGNNECNKAKQ
jgi:hypothetical protein